MNNRLEAEIRQLKVDGEAKHKRAEILIDDITEMRHLSKFLEQKKIFLIIITTRKILLNNFNIV